MTNSRGRVSADGVQVYDDSKYNSSANHAESSTEKGPPPPSEPDYDMTPDEERRMVRKCDWRILPIISALYVMSFLNRVNIGNARIFHLERDLGLTGNDYQICVSVLFATYVTFEIPSNILLKKLQPRRFIPGVAIAWGLVSLCTGFVQNKTQMIALRLLLGVFEAGYFPGAAFYLTFFYRRRELAVRVFYLYSSSALAGILGGLIAYGVGHMDGARGLSAWRWLMILEGVPTIMLGIIAFLVLANDPSDASFLTERERSFVPIRRHLDGSSLGMDGEGKIDWEQSMSAFKDWKVWTLSIGQLGATVALYGYNTFLPTIISSLGYNGLYTQLLTIPCYFAGVLCFLIMAYLSDRTGRRGYFAIAGGVTAAIGYAIILGSFASGVAPQYVGCIVVGMGVYTSTGIPLSWMPSNIPSHYKRGVAQATAMALANVSGTFSPFLYRTEDKPLYRLGHAGCMGFVVLTVCMHTLTAVLLKRENTKRESGARNYRLEGKTPEEIARLGDNHPEYRYMY